MTEYPRPALTVDCVVFDGPHKVLLIKRGKEPFAGCWALPGGYVNEGETVEDAAPRELREETGLRVRDLKMLGVFSEPGRDPRGWVVSVAFWEDVQDYDRSIEVHGADDATEARWIDLNDDGEVPHPQIKGARRSLAFDHEKIIKRAYRARQHRRAF